MSENYNLYHCNNSCIGAREMSYGSWQHLKNIVTLAIKSVSLANFIRVTFLLLGDQHGFPLNQTGSGDKCNCCLSYLS